MSDNVPAEEVKAGTKRKFIKFFSPLNLLCILFLIIGFIFLNYKFRDYSWDLFMIWLEGVLLIYFAILILKAMVDNIKSKQTKLKKIFLSLVFSIIVLSLSLVGITKVSNVYADTLGSGIGEKTVVVEKTWKKSSRYDRNRYVSFKNDPKKYKTYYVNFEPEKTYKIQYLPNSEIVLNASLSR